MSELHQILARHCEVLHGLEQKFAKHLHAGHLQQWSADDVREAIQLSNQHKMLAMDAINHDRLDQALSNIETIIYIMSGFVEDLESDVDPSQLN
jgi:hypothetical protein